MRAVIVSDIHLGKYKYGKFNPETGYDSRTEDILGNIDKSIDFAIKNKVDYYFALGDFYHIKRPPQIFRKLLAHRINRVLKAGIETFLLLGNHDQGKSAGHDLVELSELSDQINKLHIIDTPTTLTGKDSLFCFLPCVNKIDYNILKEDDFEYNMDEIEKLSNKATEDKSKYKFFFGHFGTDKSVLGNSFDLGTITINKERIISVNAFSPKIWSRVYLGDIHQHQEINKICRHPGSIARVDFGEEGEQKGFYYFEDGDEKFINVPDREFKTLQVDLTNNAREKMGEFCSDVQDLELGNSIVRLKITIKTSERKLINFDALEKYLKEESWNYIGKSLTEIDDRVEEITINTNEELDHIIVFDNYMENIQHQVDADVFKDVKKEGKVLIAGILSDQGN